VHEIRKTPAAVVVPDFLCEVIVEVSAKCLTSFGAESIGSAVEISDESTVGGSPGREAAAYPSLRGQEAVTEVTAMSGHDVRRPLDRAKRVGRESLFGLPQPRPELREIGLGNCLTHWVAKVSIRACSSGYG
jgi:hypothetical protein